MNLEYQKHITDSWKFAETIVDKLEIQDRELQNQLTLMIFDKTCSPHHYFLQNNNGKTHDPPTEKQISYAKKLGIPNPENMSKNELSEAINEKVSEQ